METDSVCNANPSELRIKCYNKSIGKLEGYNCPECNNRGDYLCEKNGIEYFKTCKCMEIRKSIALMEKSGMKGMFERYTFDSFNANEEWQQDMITKAMEYAQNPSGWFFIGGQPGSGKTHICTAIVNELIKKGKDVKYMLWRDDTVRLKANITDDVSYFRMIEPLKKASVLFIDDFLKARGSVPTSADINIAYEIINYRYNNRELITVICSEMLLDKICELDMATGSRIAEMTRNYAIDIFEDINKNQRLLPN